MVAILSNRIQNEMNNNTVNTKELNDNTTNKDHQVHVQQSRSPPLAEPSTSQSEVRDSQEVDTQVPPTPQVKTPAVKAAPSTAPTANMSDASYKKTPSFDDQREEERSAFVSNVQGVEEPSSSTTEKQDQHNKSIASAIMGRAKRSIEGKEGKQEQQPSDDTPLRYYHQQDHPTPQVHNNSRGAYPHYHQQYQGYPPPHYHRQGQQHPYTYPGYYQQPPPQRTEQNITMNNSSDSAEGAATSQQQHSYANYHQGYSQGYEPQDYARHHPQEYHRSSHHYHSSYYPPHPGHYSHHPNQSYYPGVGRSGSTEASATVSHSASTEQKETASAVTESTKGKGTAVVAQDRSLSMEEDDRKLSASEASAAVHQEGSSSKIAAQPKSILKKDAPPAAPVRAFSDYEPIPLHAFSAIPDLSTSSASAKRSRPLSPASYARLYGGHQFVGTFAEPFPQYEGGIHSSPQDDDEVEFISSRRTPASAPAATKRARRTEVSPHKAPTPPRSNPPARRRRRDGMAGRVLQASASLPTEGGSWERRFRELVEYKAVHGDCEVPQNYSQNTSLGTWVNKQRMEQKNRIEGKNSSLNDARLERLESIGFRWAKRKGREAWDEKFVSIILCFRDVYEILLDPFAHMICTFTYFLHTTERTTRLQGEVW